MSYDGGVSERSYASIEIDDFDRLAEIVREDLHLYIAEDPHSRATFASKILCVALCQGAASHYADKTTGIKDFDLFTFFADDGAKPFPPRRHARYDFGQSKFGRHPEDRGYVGRRIDVMGRSIGYVDGEGPIRALCRYLETTPTKTAWHLAQKSVAIVDPIDLRGCVAWPS